MLNDYKDSKLMSSFLGGGQASLRKSKYAPPTAPKHQRNPWSWKCDARFFTWP